MSSGKTDVNYSIKVFNKTDYASVPVLSVNENKLEFELNKSCFDQKLTKCYSKIVNVHSFLLNNEELTNTQKLDYCSMERYFMKAYLKEMMKKV